MDGGAGGGGGRRWDRGGAAWQHAQLLQRSKHLGGEWHEVEHLLCRERERESGEAAEASGGEGATVGKGSV